MSFFKELSDFIGEVSKDVAKVAKEQKWDQKVKAVIDGGKVISRTLEEDGFVKFLSGESEEKLKRGYMSEIKKDYFEQWLELKSLHNFSCSIIRYIWIVMQPEDDQKDKDLNKRYKKEYTIELAFENPIITKRSLTILKNNYPKLYDIDKYYFDNLLKLQGQLLNQYKGTSTEELNKYKTKYSDHPSYNKKIHCPKCGSLRITGKKRGVSITQAIGGGILLGPLGLLHGMTCMNDIKLVCNDCGENWEPAPTDYNEWPEYRQ